jgi:hypothetical protein
MNGDMHHHPPVLRHLKGLLVNFLRAAEVVGGREGAQERERSDPSPFAERADGKSEHTDSMSPRLPDWDLESVFNRRRRRPIRSESWSKCVMGFPMTFE